MATVLLSLCVSAWAASPKKIVKVDPGRDAAEKALRAEVAGQVDRRENLARALIEAPESQAVRWQAGFVRDGKTWRSFDESAGTNSNSAVIDEYQSRRREVPQTVTGQVDLANWCKKHGLVDQERAHLNAALFLAPTGDQTEIRRRLGWQEIGGVLFSPDDLQAWQRFVTLTEASLKHWDPKLTQIVKGLSGSPKQRDLALAALKQIKEPDAVPAIELKLAGLSEEGALVAVDAMRRIEGIASTLALARHAVFSPWPEVRKSAALVLKTRTLDDFVPPMISLLATPVKTETRVTAPMLIRGAGAAHQLVFVVSYLLFRETGDQFQVATLNTANYQINDPINGAVFRRLPTGTAGDLQFLSDLPVVRRGQNDALRTSADQVAAREREVQAFNERTEELNGRIGAVLSAVSGKDPSSTPQVWWDWWHQESDTQLAGGKQTVAVTEEYFIGNPQSSFQPYDCLAAGTPVWTDRGLLPIETIAVGDRVLSQDVESGKLAYKPVLHTTIRPPKELLTVRFDEESLVLTGGHRFWCSGSGWVKSRDLESLSLLHTVTGSTPAWAVKKGETAQTYNLLVADFHTYFVGKTGLLSQDVLTPRGTDNLVPGLSRAAAIARK